MDTFTGGYILCALWSSSDCNEEGTECTPFDQIDADLSEEALDQMEEDCRDFQQANAADLEEYYQERSNAHAGHDFWLTRNGHGAGFWDRGLGELGERLTKASKAFGECDLYLGDDGQFI